MPFEVIRNDITAMAVDAIVNTANPEALIGLGTDSMIHQKAGPQLLEARKKIGRIPAGHAVLTPAFNLPSDYVIHTVGPLWEGGSRGEEGLLRSCYDNSLSLALEKGFRSVAFPLISAGNYGFPKDKALQIALSSFTTFLTKHDMQIYLVVFDRDSFLLSEKLFQQVSSYIDEHYVEACRVATYGIPRENRPPVDRWNKGKLRISSEKAFACPPLATAKASSLEDILKQEDIGFTEALLQLIDRSGKKDSEIYKKANISKQHFSKIRNNPAYRPNKSTALAFAVALELGLEETKDLIGRAGFALTNSSKQDLIVKYFIEQRNFNIMEINLALYEFDQGLLGSA